MSGLPWAIAEAPEKVVASALPGSATHSGPTSYVSAFSWGMGRRASGAAHRPARPRSARGGVSGRLGDISSEDRSGVARKRRGAEASSCSPLNEDPAAISAWPT